MLKIVKSKKELLKWFEKHGWVKCDYDYGYHHEKESFHFHDDMFLFCDKVIDVSKFSNYYHYREDRSWDFKKGWLVKDRLVKTVKSKEELIQMFADKKWTREFSGGYTRYDFQYKSFYFNNKMFDYCGKTFRTVDCDGYYSSPSNRWHWDKELFID